MKTNMKVGVLIITIIILFLFFSSRVKRSKVVKKLGLNTPLPTGTLVVMDGYNSIQDGIIRNLTLSGITHVGVIVRDSENKPFLFHSTGKKGAGLVPWGEWLRKNLEVAHILVRFPSVSISSGDMEHAISGLYGTKYAYHLWKGVLRRWVRFELPGDDKHSKGMFCSELVCRVFENLGMMDFSKSDLTPSLVMPVHFGGEELPFVGVQFSPFYELG